MKTALIIVSIVLVFSLIANFIYAKTILDLSARLENQ